MRNKSIPRNTGYSLIYTTIDKKDILVPLTNSLYVKGKLSRPDRVLVDIGTGFYVEKVRILSLLFCLSRRLAHFSCRMPRALRNFMKERSRT